MKCEEAEVLLHGLLDGELDANQMRDIETHLAGCPRCAAGLAGFRALRTRMSSAGLNYTAPDRLRRRIEAAGLDAAVPAVRAAPSRRSLLKGFALGSALSAVAATGVVVIVMRSDRDQRVLRDVVSAHLRSLQAEHLTDVPSGDRDTVKPWFNGRLAAAPPVVDLTAQGFTLLGGRLDTIDGQAVAALVYKRRTHVINLFVAQSDSTAHSPLRADMVQGLNIGRWADQGLSFTAVSDINSGELQEFHVKYEAAVRAGA